MIVSYKTIGRNIRVARQAAGLTQEKAAERLKMSQLHFGRLERGERPASLEQIARIAQMLGVTTTSLLNGSITDESFAAVPNTSSETLAETIAGLANGCSEDAQVMMLELCKTVAQQDKMRNSPVKK